MDLTSLSVIRYLCDKYGFEFSKTLGQNFLVNAAIPKKTAEGADINGKFVIEIGPGFGCLTKELCERAKFVAAVEIDRSLLPVLSETLSEFDNLEIINSDILDVDIAALCEKYGYTEAHICANLPYYITTPIIMKILESSAFDNLVVYSRLTCVQILGLKSTLSHKFCPLFIVIASTGNVNKSVFVYVTKFVTDSTQCIFQLAIKIIGVDCKIL